MGSAGEDDLALPQPGLQQQGIPDAPAGAEDGAGLPGQSSRAFCFSATATEPAGVS